MAHYSFINEDKIVTEVITGRDEDDPAEGVESWETHYGDFRGQTCFQTSYNTLGGVHYTTDEEGNRVPSEDQTKAFRKNYAGIGFTYDEERDAFIPPKPYESWLLDEDTCLWNAPVPYPAEGGPYTWDEEIAQWVSAD
jgi:hypothetical protein